MPDITSPTPLAIIGAGGFGREVLDVADAINAAAETPVWDIVGVADDAPSNENLQRLERRGVAFLGQVADLPRGLSFSVGIGAPRVRRRIACELEARGLLSATLIHPTVSRGFGVEVGFGSVLCAGVRLTTNIRIGRHVHVNLNTTVGHDTIIGDYVSLNPLVSISGDCVVEDDVLVGVAGIVLNGLTVSRGAVVGGSACVTKDVAPASLVKGVPAR